MIAKLTGIIDSVGSSHVVVDVNGVGYLVFASGRTLSRIGSEHGTPVSLLIETIVREDSFNLYGFADNHEKEWFNLLCTVQGVGAKVALLILSVIDAERLAVVIASEDKAAIQQADGIGPKLATRIITELKDKAGKIAMGENAFKSGIKGKAGAVKIPVSNSNDAISALINLGYGRAEAFGAVTNVVARLGEDTTVDKLITEGLRELSA